MIPKNRHKLIFKCLGCGDTSFRSFEEVTFHSKKICLINFPEIIVEKDE